MIHSFQAIKVSPAFMEIVWASTRDIHAILRSVRLVVEDDNSYIFINASMVVRLGVATSKLSMNCGCLFHENKSVNKIIAYRRRHRSEWNHWRGSTSTTATHVRWSLHAFTRTIVGLFFFSSLQACSFRI